MEQFYVYAAAEGSCKGVAGAGCTKATAGCVGDAKERLREGSDALGFAIRKARTEKVGGNGAVNSCAENIVGVITAEISHGAEPVICVVGNARAAAVKIEAVYARCAGVIAEVRISGEDVNFRDVLRERRRSRKAEERKQTHYDSRLHYSLHEVWFLRRFARQWRNLACAGPPQAEEAGCREDSLACLTIEMRKISRRLQRKESFEVSVTA